MRPWPAIRSLRTGSVRLLRNLPERKRMMQATANCLDGWAAGVVAGAGMVGKAA
jgi:hypothetical protein